MKKGKKGEKTMIKLIVLHVPTKLKQTKSKSHEKKYTTAHTIENKKPRIMGTTIRRKTKCIIKKMRRDKANGGDWPDSYAECRSQLGFESAKSALLLLFREAIL